MLPDKTFLQILEATNKQDLRISIVSTGQHWFATLSERKPCALCNLDLGHELFSLKNTSLEVVLLALVDKLVEIQKRKDRTEWLNCKSEQEVTVSTLSSTTTTTEDCNNVLAATTERSPVF